MKIFTKVKINNFQKKVRKIDKNHFEVWIKEKPIQGKANKTLVKLLADYFDVSLSEIKIISGVKSKEKIIQINEKK